MLVPEAGGSMLNEEVLTSTFNGPSWSRDQLAVSLPIPVGTATECWRPAVESGASRLTRRKRARKEGKKKGRKKKGHQPLAQALWKSSSM